ncbi:hypothetical protein [Streptomyces griseochromogenes]|uniref:hypothetical protein n=1 Tax=Streptomyces griseochromogenes TaxID=68214 RepID=UPI0037B45CEE
MAGLALAITLTGCTASRPPADRPGWNAGSARESAERVASLCADPAGRPGAGGDVPPVAPTAATTGGAPALGRQVRTVEGDEAPMPALPGASVLVFCVYGPPPVSPVPVPAPPSCPPWLVSDEKPRPGAAWVIAPDGTPSSVPYPRSGTFREGECAPTVDDARTRQWL